MNEPIKRIAIIPARGGSKRIPKKNIKEFGGKPIISYPITAALKSRIFKRVVVSTDCEEIKTVSEEFGAEVPFMRSKENADDHAPLIEVLIEVLGEFKTLNEVCHRVACILPTSVFIDGRKIKEASELLEQSATEAVLTVTSFDFPIQRSLKENGEYLEFTYPEHILTRSQDLDPRYHDAGQLYFLKERTIVEEKTLFPVETRAIRLSPLQVHDIDTEEDWKLAELKYSLLYGKE